MTPFTPLAGSFASSLAELSVEPSALARLPFLDARVRALDHALDRLCDALADAAPCVTLRAAEAFELAVELALLVDDAVVASTREDGALALLAASLVRLIDTLEPIAAPEIRAWRRELATSVA